MLCGLSDNAIELTAARVLQGFGGAMMVPVGRLVLFRSVERSQLVRTMAYLQVPAQLGPVLGPPIGGFITTYFSWRWIFLVNVPLGILGIVLVTPLLRQSEGGRAAPAGLGRFPAHRRCRSPASSTASRRSGAA